MSKVFWNIAQKNINLTLQQMNFKNRKYIITPNYINNKIINLLLFIVSLTFTIFLQFRAQLLNNFSILYGDRYDATIVVTILEHWHNVLRGLTNWSGLYYFYPYTKTLGQTDGYFLLGIIYSAFRYFEIDPFLSSELTNISVRAIGFFTFFIVFRKIVKVPFGWSLLAAALFTISNNLTIHGQRLQLASLSFAPIAILLIWKSCNAWNSNNSKKFTIFGSATGIFLGAWSITCFYITWFFLFFSICFSFLFLIIGGVTKFKKSKDKIKSQIFPIVIVTAITALSLLPLLSVYLEKSKDTGMRSYKTVLSNTIPVEGILQVGKDNYMFGELYNRLLSFTSPNYIINSEYYNTGIAPILLFVFLVGCIFFIKKKSAGNDVVIFKTTIFAILITWAMSLNLAGYSAWYFVYHLIPGAKALNVVAAYQIFLTLPILVIAIKYLSLNTCTVPRAIIFLLVTLLIAEELNHGAIGLIRKDEIERVTLRAPQPSYCSSFFVSGWANQSTVTPMVEWINNYYAHNVSAMLIAELIRLPTVNGVASFNLPDWDFGYPNNADYDDRVNRYAKKHNINSLCKLNLNTKEWTHN